MAVMRLRRALLLFPMVATMSHAENPFDFASTPGKLPKQVVPTEYAVRIVPNIEKFTFSGSDTVKLDVREPVRKLVLNALDMDVASASVDGKPLSKAAIKIDRKTELLQLDLPNGLPAGEHTLALTFSGRINPQGQGLYYCKYQEQG